MTSATFCRATASSSSVPRGRRSASQFLAAVAAIVAAFSGLEAFAQTVITGTTTLSGTLSGLYELSDADGSVLMEGASEIDGVASFSFNYLVDPTVPATLAATLSGTGGLELTNAGTLLITNANTYSGGTTIAAGTISLGSTTALGSGTISFSGSSGVLQYTTGITTDYSSQISTAGSQTIIIDTNIENVTFTTGLVGAGTILAKIGDGTLTLSGANIYTGDTIAVGGTLDVTMGGSITTGIGNLIVGGGTFSVSGGSVGVANATANGGSLVVNSGALNANGLLTVGDTDTGTMLVGGGTVTTGSTTLGAVAGSAGTLIVSGGSFTSTGDLAVGVGGGGLLQADTAGTIAVGGTLSKGLGGSIDIANGGTLRIGLGATTGTLAGDLTIGSGGSLVFDRSNDSIYGGIIDGSGSVTKEGAGTLTFTGENTYLGGSTISSGTLQIGDGSTTGSIFGDVVNNATLAFNRSDAMSFAGGITGTGSLLQVGTGTLILTGSSGYSGATTVAAGTLEVTTGGVIDHTSAALLVGDGTTAAFVVSGGSVTNGDGTVGRGATGNGAATITAGQWTNTGDLVIGENGATGLLAIQGGRLAVGGALTRGTNGTITLSSGGTLQIGIGGATGALGTDLVNDGALVFDGASAYAGIVSGTGTFAKQGGGTLTLSGSISSGGATVISGGTLDVVAGGLLAPAGADLLVGPDGSTGTLSVSGGTVSSNVGSIGYHGTGAATVSAGSWTNAGDLRIGWGMAGEPTTGPGDGTFTLSGGTVSNIDAYLGVAAGSVGSATVSNGSWQSAGALSVGWGGGSGSLGITGGSVTAVDATLGSGVGSTGTATVGGGTWANSGLLAVGYDGGSGGLTLTTGTVTSGTGWVGSGGGSIGTATVSGGLWQTTGDMVVGNDGTGTLSISGSGVVAIGGNLSRGSGGSIDLAAGGTLRIGLSGTSGEMLTDLANNGTLVFDRSDDSIYSGILSGTGAVTKLGAGTLTFAGQNTATGLTTITAGTLQIGDGIVDGAIAGDVLNNASLAFNTIGTNTYAGNISGTGSLTTLGAGTLILTESNTFTGLTTVSEGTLLIGDGGATGSIAGDIRNDATLAFNRSGSLTYGGVISGAGTLVNQGSGTVTLTGTNTSTGDTLLQAGTLSVGSAGALGPSGTISFTGGALQFTSANTTDYSSRFSTADNQAYKLDTNGQNVALAANLTSSGGVLEKLGAGILSLSGSNTFAGGTTLSAGTLSLDSADALGPADPNDPTAGTISFAGGTLRYTANNAIDYSGRFSTAASQAFTIDTNGQSVTFASNLTSDGASLAKLGSGTLGLTGSNDVSGGLSLNGGTLSLGSADAIGSSGAIEFVGGTLQFTDSNTTDVSARFSAATGQSFSIDTNGQTVAFDTAITGTGNTLTKLGSGTLTLSANNTYTGVTTLSAGMLRIGSGGSSGSVAGNIVTDAALVFDRSDEFTIAGDISGTGSLEKLGSGTLTLAGNSSYTGETQINVGTLALGSTGALGSSGQISFGGGVLQFTGSNTTDYSSRFSTAAGQAIRIDTNGQTVDFTTGLGGVGSSLEKIGLGTLTLSGASTYDGGTSIGGGTLDVTTGGSISHGSADLTVGTSAGNGALQVSGGRVTNAGGSLGTVAGSTGMATITSGSWENTGAVKLGAVTGAAGVLTIQGGSVTSDTAYLGFAVESSGTATVTGGTWTNNGDLRVGYDGTGALGISGSGVVAIGGNLFQGSGGSIDLAAGGTLRIGLSGTSGELLTDLANNGTLVFDRSDDSSYFGILSGTGAVTKLGAGTLTFTGQNTATGLTTITAGTLQIGDGTVDGAIAGDVLNNANLAFNTIGTNTYAGNISGTGSLTTLGAGTLTLTGSSDSTGVTTLTGGTLALGSADAIGSSGTISFVGGTLQYSAGNTTDYSSRFSNAANQAYSIDTNGQSVTLASDLNSSGGSFTILGTGTLTFSGSNGYDGGTTVTAGTLRIGDGGTNGSLVGNIANAGAVVFDRADDSIFAGVISGTGTLAKLGDGMLSLTGENTFTGLATIQSGMLSIGNGGTTGSALAEMVNNGVLAFNRSDAIDYAGSVSGSGSLLKLGAGILTLSGSSSYSGGTKVNDGTLAVAAGGVISHASADLFVGFGVSGAASGTFNLSGGTVETGRAFLGVFASGTGSATVSSGTWTNLGDLFVGYNGGVGSLDITGGTASTVSTLIGTSAGSTGLVAVTSGTWTSSGDVTVGSTSGTGSLTISGSGTALIGGTLSRGDLGTIDLASGGTLQIGLGVGSGTLAGDLVNNGTLIFNRSDDSSATGSISGTGTVTKLGAGTLSLDGTNSYTGGTTITAGAISLGSLDALGTTGTISFNGGALQFTATNTTDYSPRFSTDADQSYAFDTNGQEVTLATGLTSSGGSLTKTGFGTLILTGANTFTGLTTVLSGTLQIGNGGGDGSIAGNIAVDSDLVFNRSGTTTYSGTISGFGNVTKLGSGTLLLTGDKLAFGTTTVAAGTLEIGNGGTTGWIRGDIHNEGTVVFNRSDALNYTGNIDGAGDVTKLGDGTLTLAGDNSFTGVMRIDAGTLAVANAGALGSGTSQPTISFGGGVLQYTSQNQVDYSDRISSAAGQAIRIDTNGEAVAFATGLAGVGSTLEKIGLGTLTLSGSSNYTGSTTLNGGEAIVAAGGAISHSDAGLFVGTDSTTATLSISGGSVTDASAVVGSGSGGNGTVVVSDGTWVTLGDLVVGGSRSSVGVLDVSGGSVSNANATLGFDADALGSATVTGGQWTTNGNLTVGRDGTGVLTISGSGSVIVGGTLTRGSSGSIDLAAGGTLRIGLSGTSGELLTDLANNGTLIFDRSDDSIYSGILSGNGAVTKLGGGTLTLTGQNTATGLTTITEGTLQIGDGTVDGAIAGDVFNNASLAFNTIGTQTYVGSISGTGSLTKLGAGMLTLTGSNDFTGGTTLAAGTLVLGSADAIGSSGTISFGGGVLQYSASNTVDYSSSILNSGGAIWIDTDGQDVTFVTSLDSSNTGGLTKSGLGTLTLSASNGFTGSTTLTAGTLALGNADAIGSSGTISFGGGMLQYSASNTVDYSSNILNSSSAIWIDTNGQDVTFATSLDSSNTGGLTKSGLGTLTLSASNGYTGVTTISSGTLRIGDGSTNGSIDGDVVNNDSLVFSRSDASTYAGIISGTGAVTKQGAGTLNFTGMSSYTGATDVEDGALLVNGQLGHTAVTVSASSLLGGGGTILGDVFLSGTLSPGNSPGVLTVGSLSLLAGSQTLMEITGTSASLYDQVVGTGSGGLTYGGSLDLVMSGSYADQTTFHLFSNFTSNTGDFSGVGLNAVGEYAGLTFTGTDSVWTSTWTVNHQRIIFSTVTGDLIVVPEPSTYAMAIAGLAFGGWKMLRRRRRLRQPAPLAA